jgi:peptide deformylase
MKKPIRICHVPEPVLRQLCLPIAPNAITSPETKKILSEMSQALAESGDGVAIAAPQIGYAVRIFVVSGQILDVLNNYHGEHTSPDKVFINPEIIKASKTKKTMKGEGCLSVRFVYGATKRSEKVTVKATDEKGTEFIMSATGLLAQIFQHEIDHLNGILFVDHATGIREMTDEEKASYQIELEDMKAERMNT